MEKMITITRDNITCEHICCAFSDKKCAEGYELKKKWLTREFDEGYVFRRLDARAKVFIEYGPAEKAWIPVEAPNYLMINCFWVSGQYKEKGYGKTLLESALEDARRQGKAGLITVTGTRKFHFMSDTKWLLRQGFEECQRLTYGFSLLVKKIDPQAENPRFKELVLNGECPDKQGITAYYSNRCPFTEYYVREELVKTATNRQLPLQIIKLASREEARSAPTPATIFSLFYHGKFVTTDISICLDSRFDKIFGTSH